MKTKNKLGRIWDARQRKPTEGDHVLVFLDELFDWVIAVYDGQQYCVPILHGTKRDVLYWTPLPPFSLSILRRLSCNHL